MKRMYNWIHILRQAAVIGMMLVLFLSQTACTASGSKKGNAMVPGSSITPAWCLEHLCHPPADIGW